MGKRWRIKGMEKGNCLARCTVYGTLAYQSPVTAGKFLRNQYTLGMSVVSIISHLSIENFNTS